MSKWFCADCTEDKSADDALCPDCCGFKSGPEARVREAIAQAIEAEAPHEGPRAQRIIRLCAHVARHCDVTAAVS